MPAGRFPDRPNLEQLQNHAQTLQQFVRARVPQAVDLVREFHPRLGEATTEAPELARFRITDARLVLARHYGFSSWSRMRQHIEIIDRYSRAPHQSPVSADPGEEFLRLACLNHGDDDPERVVQAASRLATRPSLAAETIYTAAAVGDTDAVRHHLDLDPACAGREGGPHRWEPLLYLAYSALDSDRCAHLEAARVLLDAGADPNAGYLWEGLPSPYTALTGAFGPHGHSLDLARLLLERGADPNDSQALYELGFTADPEPLALLFEFGLGRPSRTGWHARLAPRHPTPAQLVEDELLTAAARDWSDRAELLLAHDVDVRGTGTAHPVHHGHNAYELAVLNGSRSLEALLAAAGARPASPDPVLDFIGACMRGDRDSVEQMRRQDPAIVERAVASESPLVSMAADRDRVEVVTLLVELGFDVNAPVPRPHRQTALHGAAFNGNLALVEYLLEHGADPTAEDCSFHATPQGWADHNNQRHVVEYLAARADAPADTRADAE